MADCSPTGASIYKRDDTGLSRANGDRESVKREREREEGRGREKDRKMKAETAIQRER